MAMIRIQIPESDSKFRADLEADTRFLRMLRDRLLKSAELIRRGQMAVADSRALLERMKERADSS
jgi:hypothetical protein